MKCWVGDKEFELLDQTRDDLVHLRDPATGHKQWTHLDHVRSEPRSVPTEARPAIPAGYKETKGKLQWALLVLGWIQDVIRVREFGVAKYGKPQGWREVPDPVREYWQAAMRHLAKLSEGEILDQESGLPHTAHAACDLMFLWWFLVRDPARIRELTDEVT